MDFAAHARATHVARTAATPVDVHLPAMVVDTRLPAHRGGLMLEPDSVDAPDSYAFGHQRAQVVPDIRPLAAPQQPAGHERIDPVPEKQLRAVDVTDARHDGLIHQQRRDRCPRTLDAAPGTIGVGVGAQGIRAEPRGEVSCLCGGPQLARVRAAQIGVRIGPRDAQAYGAARIDRSSTGDVEGAVQPEVYVHEPLGVEADQQVLPVRFRVREPRTVEQRGGFGEPSLRTAYAYTLTCERRHQRVREAVEGVTFWHRSGSAAALVRVEQVDPAPVAILE